MGSRVVNIFHGDRFDVAIGRPSRWGNPFKIGRDGDRAEVIRRYREWIRSDDPRAVRVRQEIGVLRGKRLGCYCAPLPCHGDVLAEMADAAADAGAARGRGKEDSL